MHTRRNLSREAAVLGLAGRLYYLEPSSGLTLGQYLLAHRVGAVPVRGNFVVRDDGALATKPLHGGQILVVTLDLDAVADERLLVRLLAAAGSARSDGGIGGRSPRRQVRDGATRCRPESEMSRRPGSDRRRYLQLRSTRALGVPHAGVAGYWLPALSSVVPASPRSPRNTRSHRRHEPDGPDASTTAPIRRARRRCWSGSPEPTPAPPSSWWASRWSVGPNSPSRWLRPATRSGCTPTGTTCLPRLGPWRLRRDLDSAARVSGR